MYKQVRMLPSFFRQITSFRKTKKSPQSLRPSLFRNVLTKGHDLWRHKPMWTWTHREKLGFKQRSRPFLTTCLFSPWKSL